MKQLVIVVKPFRAESVLQTIARLNVGACMAREVKGYSRQKGYLDRYVGSEYNEAFLPKVEITVWVENDRAEEIIRQVVTTARTGRMGDGKVFLLDLAWDEAIDF